MPAESRSRPWPRKAGPGLVLSLGVLTLPACAWLPANPFATHPATTGFGDLPPPAGVVMGPLPTGRLKAVALASGAVVYVPENAPLPREASGSPPPRMVLAERVGPARTSPAGLPAGRAVVVDALALPPAGQTAATLDAEGVGLGRDIETFTTSPDRPAIYYAALPGDVPAAPVLLPTPPPTLAPTLVAAPAALTSGSYYQNRATMTGRLDTTLDSGRAGAGRRPRLPEIAQPLRPLRLTTRPSEAWRGAVIPVGTQRLVVGRMPPPALPDGPVIGVGDTLALAVSGRPEFTSTTTVSADGRVPVALIGPVGVLGLSPSQASDRIADELKRGGFLVNPQVSVLLTDSLTRQVSVLGEVKTPGRFPLKTRLSVVDALALAGGVAETGGGVAYVLRPEGEKVTRYEINLDRLLQQGEGQQFFEVLPNDSVLVPRAEQVFIYGQVRQPAAFRLRPGMTVIQLLSLAGGLTDRGTERNIEIRHRDPDGRLDTRTARLEDPLAAGDVVYVRERLF